MRRVILTPKQAALRRLAMKGLTPRPLGNMLPRPLGGITPRPLGSYVNNFWQNAIHARAPYVLTFDQLGARIRPSLGDAATDAGMATEQGDVPIPGVDPTVAPPAPGTQRTTVINVNALPVTTIVPGGSNGINVTDATAPKPPQPGFFDQVTGWLSQPLSAGSSIKNGHAVALGAGLALIAAKRGRRK